MIVVADTTPLNYLVLIGEADVLQRLYARVIVPHTVLRELRHPKTPAAVQIWIAQPPEWLEERPDPPLDSTLSLLDPGERAALTLAEILQADEILMDDTAGRRIAKRRHLKVTGTLGVLSEAQLAGLLDFDRALAQLRMTNFRLSDDVERTVRRRLYPQKKEP